MQTLFMMRYSYFGNSGWRSPASKDPGQLLSAERLKKRFELLRDIALPSLADQDDPDFKLAILSSKSMPRWRKRQLVELTHDILGADRVDVVFKPQASAPLMFKNYLHTRFAPETLLSQVVLDDDDAVARDFVSLIKREANAAYQLRRPGKQHCFLSFPKGLSLDLGAKTPSLYHRLIPFTNLGLTMVGRAGAHKNVYGVAHKKVAKFNPARVIYTQQPAYVRTVHGQNDSKAVLGDQLLDSQSTANMLDCFPFLEKFFPELVFEDVPQRLAA